MALVAGGILIGALVIGAATDGAPPAETATAQAQVLFEQGEVVQGRALLEQTIKKSPLYMPAYILLGQSLLGEDAPRARLFATEVLRVDPDNKDALDLLSKSYERARAGGLSLETETKLRALEISDYAAVLKQRPNHADLLYRSASQRLALERLLPAAQLEPRRKMLEQAVDELRRLREVLAKHPDATLRAAAHFQSGRAIKHQGDFERNIKKDPSDFYQRSIEQFQACLKLEPDRIDALGEIVLILGASQNQASARKLVAAHLDKTQAEWARAKVLSMLGNLEIEQGDHKPGVKHIEKALTLNPKLMDGYLGLYRSDIANGLQGAAIETMERAVAAEPNFLLGHLLIAQHHADAKRYDAAIESFESVLKVAPEKAAVLGMLPSKNLYRNGLYYDAASRLAWLYMRHRGDALESLQMADRAQSFAPADPYLMDTIGWVYFKLGKLDDAKSTLETALSENDKIASAQFHLAQVLNAMGDKAAARKTLHRAFELGQEFSQIEDAQALREALKSD